ncbi:MAG: hypothetical protein V1847_04810 [Candidatus Diapherotrites archaeon]
MKSSNEKIASELVSIYFENVARHSRKRSMELDDLVKAYHHALARLDEERVQVKILEPSPHSKTLELIAKEVKGE